MKYTARGRQYVRPGSMTLSSVILPPASVRIEQVMAYAYSSSRSTTVSSGYRIRAG